MTTLSLCMIVKNEAHNILDCLGFVGNLPTEAIIVDTGSTDGNIYETGIHEFLACSSDLEARGYHSDDSLSVSPNPFT